MHPVRIGKPEKVFGRQQVMDMSPARFNAQQYAEQEFSEPTAHNARFLFAQNNNELGEQVSFCLDFFLFKGVV